MNNTEATIKALRSDDPAPAGLLEDLLAKASATQKETTMVPARARQVPGSRVPSVSVSPLTIGLGVAAVLSAGKIPALAHALVAAAEAIPAVRKAFTSAAPQQQAAQTTPAYTPSSRRSFKSSGRRGRGFQVVQVRSKIEDNQQPQRRQINAFAKAPGATGFRKKVSLASKAGVPVMVPVATTRQVSPEGVAMLRRRIEENRWTREHGMNERLIEKAAIEGIDPRTLRNLPRPMAYRFDMS